MKKTALITALALIFIGSQSQASDSEGLKINVAMQDGQFTYQDDEGYDIPLSRGEQFEATINACNAVAKYSTENGGLQTDDIVSTETVSVHINIDPVYFAAICADIVINAESSLQLEQSWSREPTDNNYGIPNSEDTPST